MIHNFRSLALCACAFLIVLGMVLANQSLAEEKIPGHRATMSFEPAKLMHSEAIGEDFEIQIALPASYHHSKKVYPVLYVTDGSGFFEMAVGVIQTLTLQAEAPEMVIVAVGCPREASMMEYARRRTYEFSPSEIMAYEGVGGDLLEAGIKASGFKFKAGGASLFLAFLTDELMPSIARDYRVDTKDQGLFGISGGGMFVGYALFAKPDAFAKYICGSPSLNAGNFEIFKMEERYAANHKDMKVSVFFGAGDTEIGNYGMAAWGIVSCTARMAEILSLRKYPSLKLVTKIFPGETHVSAPPFILSWGVRILWGK